MTHHSSGRTSTHPAGRVAEIALAYLGSLALSHTESLFYEQLLFSPSTVGSQRLSNLGLDERDLAILMTVTHCRLITTLQLQRIHFTKHNSPVSSARACRRVLKRLTEQKVICRRKRRIGGVRSGSASFVYSVGSVGARLIESPDKRLRPYTTDPSDYFFEHTIELAELYTHLYEQHIAGRMQLLEIQTEPDCWRQLPASREKLRPDMFVRIAKSDEEYSFFIELDRGTTHLPSVLRKMHQYEQYYASGMEQTTHEVFPQVLWIVPDSKRQTALQKAVEGTHRPVDGLFVVETNNITLLHHLRSH